MSKFISKIELNDKDKDRMLLSKRFFGFRNNPFSIYYFRSYNFYPGFSLLFSFWIFNESLRVYNEHKFFFVLFLKHKIFSQKNFPLNYCVRKVAAKKQV